MNISKIEFLIVLIYNYYLNLTFILTHLKIGPLINNGIKNKNINLKIVNTLVHIKSKIIQYIVAMI